MKLSGFGTGFALLLAVLLFLAFITFNDTAGFILIQIVLGAGGLMLLYSLCSQLREASIRPTYRLHSKAFSLKFIATLMGFFLVVGTGLYFYVFYSIAKSDIVFYSTIDGSETGHVRFSNAEYLLRSLICSLDLFMLDVDSNILDRLDDKPLTKALISIQAVFSFSCTVMAVAGLVYSRLNAWYKLTYKTKINSTHNHLYLFFGVNEPSETLVKDIVRNDPDAIIVLIDEMNVNDDDSNGWEGIIGLFSHKNKHKTYEIAGNYGVRVALSGKLLSDIDEEIASSPGFDAFGYLGLSRIRKLIERLKQVKDAQLHIFFLNESEERNIRDIITLAKDKTILSLAGEDKVQHKIYCHARYNGPNRVIKDVAVKKKLNIKIIDSSHMAVERLKLLPEFHPYNVAEFDKDNPATVKGSFDALIIGFGEVGRDAFRFLYEFAAFVNNDATTDNARRSRFNCTIVDKDVERIEGTFKAGMPAIFDNCSLSPKEGISNNIEFKAVDYNHDSFFSEVLNKETIANLNYVVISIGDNDEAIALATRIFNRFRQYGGDPGKLMILVRCTDDAKVEAIQKIADHYNFGYGAGADNRSVIHIFGQPEETYTYDLVISNRLLELGKRFYENYRIISGEGESWDKRHKSYTQTPLPNIDKLRKMRRQESQDMANALHMPTKMAFLKEAMPADTDWTDFLHRYFKADGSPNRTGTKSGIRYPELSDYENLLILRLAMLEHLRWNAAHELLGYVRRDDGVAACDEMTMRHNCLKDWDELDVESEITERGDWPCDYKKYDFCVVDTTISLYNENHTELKNAETLPGESGESVKNISQDIQK